jgi:hypothetical protein
MDVVQNLSLPLTDLLELVFRVEPEYAYALVFSCDRHNMLLVIRQREARKVHNLIGGRRYFDSFPRWSVGLISQLSAL